MSSPVTTLPFILILFFTRAAVPQTPTAYEVLQEYDFPVGLLPTNVTSYAINRATGEFLVNLGDKCSFSADGYHVRFKPMVTGVITKDKLTNLKGVSVKFMFFRWMEVVKATRDEDELDFYVGMLSAGFDVEAFEESPRCGCGFDCDGLRMTGENKGVKLRKMLDWVL